MNILIDIGNTTIQIGIYQGDKLIDRHIVSTDLNKLEGDYYSLFLDLFSKYLNSDIKHIIISSVVPKINDVISSVFEKMFKVKPMIMSIGFKTKVIFRIDNIKELGSDLICDVCGGIAKYNSPLIIIDMGTATKILVVDNNSIFIGCIFIPGLSISKDSLTSKTALLPDTDYTLPKNILGKNSIDAIKSGVILGHILMLEGFINKIKEQYNYDFKIVVTGGNAIHLKDEFIKLGYIYDNKLVLDGLNEILKRNVSDNNEK